MEINARTKTITLAILAIACLILATFSFYAFSSQRGSAIVISHSNPESNACITFTVHCTVTMYKNGVKIFEQYHAGAVTKLGMNVTLSKLTGDSWYNLTWYNLNTTYISIGDMGTLNTDSVCLPGEWNRTAGTVEDQAYNSYNLTATIHPGTGPYTADCIGGNFEDGIGNNALAFYDTFTQVTGIDNTFTIIIEFKFALA